MIGGSDTEAPVYHDPVLCRESIDLLVVNREGIYVDGTCGGGGHTREILRRLTRRGRVVGIDQDREAVRYCQTVLGRDGRFAVEYSNFSRVRSILHKHRIDGVDGLLLDLGVSSRQLDEPDRGFSYRFEGPLDMRMDRDTEVNAMMIINTYSRDELAGIFFQFGEESRSRQIADAIVRVRRERKITTTTDLRTVIQSSVSERVRVKSLSRVFQALRLTVNEELHHLRTALEEIRGCLLSGGRIVVLSYHSLEDRIVKNFFRQESVSCVCPPRTPVCVCGTVPLLQVLTPRAIRPSEVEIRHNPRARSARLRAAKKII